MREYLQYLRDYWRLRPLFRSAAWDAAEKAVARVANHYEINQAAQNEPMIAYCPRCGQVPDGDRRQEEAREIAVTILGHTPRRSDLDFALAWHYWRRKNAQR